MKTNNRPTIKLVEWEVRTKSDFLLWNSPDDTAIWDGERTGNTREVERPMNDTEYIKHLEKENEELKEKLETKTHFLTLEEKRVSNLMKLVNEQQDQFLKVVESVIVNHTSKHTDCPCGSGDYYTEHLLQEIKSAMEKGKE